MVGETMSVTCAEQLYQHNAPELVLMICTYYILHDCYWIGVVQSYLHSGANNNICCMIAETICVISSERNCQHDAPVLALMLEHICNVGGSSAYSCGTTCNTLLIVH